MDEPTPYSDPFRLQPQPLFSLTLEERMRHVYVGGKSGVGKSTLLYNLAAADIEAGHGVCFIDPHGDEVERLLDAIPKARINDVIHFNVADRDFPVAFNPVAGVPEDERPRRISNLVSSFAHVWHDAWGHSTEQITRNAIATLVSTPGMSLVALPRLLTDPQFRSGLVSRVTDPVVRAYWRDQFDAYKDDQRNQKIAPVLNKAEELIAEPHLRNILAAGSNTIEPRTIIDGRKILLVNLAKGLIGESACNILGCILLSLLGSASLARRDQLEDEREPFFSFVDEAHNFATTALVSQLAELRKYRYALLLASQFLDQLSEPVRDAILGVAGSLVVFEVSPADADLLSPHFGHLDSSELAVQSVGHAWVKRKDSFDAYSGSTRAALKLPERELRNAGNREAVIARSRRVYAQPKSKIDALMYRYFSSAPRLTNTGSSVSRLSTRRTSSRNRSVVRLTRQKPAPLKRSSKTNLQRN